MKSGTTNIWLENRTGLGAFYHVLPPDFSIDENLQEVTELRQGGTWNEKLLDQRFPEDIVEHIKHNVHYEGSEEYWDRGNPGPNSLGFCVRDDAGDLVYAMAVDLGVTTNVLAEAKVIVEGLKYCVKHELHPLILETESLVLKKVIGGEWDPPWCIVAEVQKIKEIRDHFNVIFQHVLREGNIVADFLASIVFSFAGSTQFHSFSELPSAGRRLLNLEKSQTPNLRARIAKRRYPD
ncbi:uncharacterized protein [Nicotiana sylvestris]|uniref:Uncharacterized protein LOC104241433 n=1 Tax=Nicotiana sylvestris TaxID=4096 RepID=A0A1U7XUR5_NICSY|nr:PREDICTED: uncharacterized protein LOC104241433 [Nicotiana sylvestris]